MKTDWLKIRVVWDPVALGQCSSSDHGTFHVMQSWSSSCSLEIIMLLFVKFFFQEKCSKDCLTCKMHMSHCKVLGTWQLSDGRGPGQPELGGAPSPQQGVGTGWALRCLLTQAILWLWFYDSTIWWHLFVTTALILLPGQRSTAISAYLFAKPWEIKIFLFKIC